MIDFNNFSNIRCSWLRLEFWPEILNISAAVCFCDKILILTTKVENIRDEIKYILASFTFSGHNFVTEANGKGIFEKQIVSPYLI